MHTSQLVTQYLGHSFGPKKARKEMQEINYVLFACVIVCTTCVTNFHKSTPSLSAHFHSSLFSFVRCLLSALCWPTPGNVKTITINKRCIFILQLLLRDIIDVDNAPYCANTERMSKYVEMDAERLGERGNAKLRNNSFALDAIVKSACVYVCALCRRNDDSEKMISHLLQLNLLVTQ